MPIDAPADEIARLLDTDGALILEDLREAVTERIRAKLQVRPPPASPAART